MTRKTSLNWKTAVLAFLLAVGPLQAQIVYACTIMGTVLQDRCCCDDAEDCTARDCDDSYPSNQDDSCCVQTVILTNDGKVLQPVLPAEQKSEIKSDVDPPASTALYTELTIPLRVLAAGLIFSPSPDPMRAGTQTYLKTQRLRL